MPRLAQSEIDDVYEGRLEDETFIAPVAAWEIERTYNCGRESCALNSLGYDHDETITLAIPAAEASVLITVSGLFAKVSLLDGLRIQYDTSQIELDEEQLRQLRADVDDALAYLEVSRCSTAC